MKKRVDLRLWHEDCWMLALTREHPGLQLVLTDICSDSSDVFATIVFDLAEVDDFELADIRTLEQSFRSVRSADVLEARPGVCRIHSRYEADDAIYTAIVDSTMTPVGEVRIADDRERWTLIVDGSDIGTSIADLEAVATVDVQRVIDYEPSSTAERDLVDEIRNELSERQLAYLLSALEEGYYSWPRDISAKELGEKHDVAGTTALEHLRTGEARVIRRVLEDVRDRERTTKRPR